MQTATTFHPTERHLYLRLDDAKANLGLLNPNPSWFRRVGVEIAKATRSACWSRSS